MRRRQNERSREESRRIEIPSIVWELLDVSEGDLVEVNIRKAKKEVDKNG